MKTRLFTTFVVSMMLGISACTKKTFEALKTPGTLIKIKSDEKIDLIQEPLKDGVVAWTDNVENLDVEGLLRVVARGNSYFFWQMKCPATLKCVGEKVYLPIVSTVAYDPQSVPFAKELPPSLNIQAFLTKLDDVYVALQTVKFMRDMKNPLPQKIIEPLFDAFLQKLNPKSKEGTDLLLRLYVFATLAADATTKDEPLPGFRPLPANFLKSIENTLPQKSEKDTRGKDPFLTGLKNYVDKRYGAFLEEEVKGFPLNAKSYKALAQNYQTLAKFPGLREKILIQIFKERVLSFSAGDTKGPNKEAPNFETTLGISTSEWRLEQAAPEQGLLFRVQPDNHEFFATIIQTDVDKKGLRFLIALEPKSEITRQKLTSNSTMGAQATTNQSQQPTTEQVESPSKTGAAATPYYIWLIPNETAVYIEGFKKFERDVADMKKQITDSDFEKGISHRSLLEFAIKFGEGGYDKNTGQYDFAVTLKPGKPYNTFLKMTKAMVGGAPTEYSGDLPDSFTKDQAGSGEYRVRWFQSAKGGSYEFGLTGSVNTVYRSMNMSEKISETCFTDGSVIHISFKTNNLSTGIPDKVTVSFPTEGGLCNKILNPTD